VTALLRSPVDLAGMARCVVRFGATGKTLWEEKHTQLTSLVEVKMLVAQLRTWPVQESRARLLLELVTKRRLCHSRKDSLTCW